MQQLDKQKIKDDQIMLKIKDGGPMPELHLKGYRGWARKILGMSNDEIIEESRKIMNRTSGLSRREREFCVQAAMLISDYNLKHAADIKEEKNGEDSDSGK